MAQDTVTAPEGTHDFNIVGVADNRVVALEITSATNPMVVSQLKAAFGREWSSSCLANNWMIGIANKSDDPLPSIRKLIAGMIPILQLFERAGETRVEVRSSRRYRRAPTGETPEMHEAMIRMFNLKVEAARVWSTPEPDARV